MMRWLIAFLLFCSGSATLAIDPHQSNSRAGATSGSGASPPSTVGFEAGYRLGIDDRVTVIVYGEDSLSKEYPVGPNGKISLPLIGDVEAAGRTVGDVAADVQHKLADGFIKSPNVSIAITNFRPFYIMGEVSKPGQYPYRNGLTIPAAVATAEGFTYRAQKRYVYIKHEGETQEAKVELTPDLAVRPGDTIRIAERYF
jgi:protein involved in polysaccharide export with SLBB domain